MSEIKQEVINFIISETSVGVEEVKLNSRLLEDLGVDGEDAEELIKNFSTKFNVNIDSFIFSSYFNPEYPFYVALFSWKKKHLKTFKVIDLINSVSIGKLI